MTDTTVPAAAPKKRSLFKRAAWQDATKKENEDIFSHSNEFKDIVAEQNRQREEEKRKKEEEARQRHSEVPRQSKGKRRKVSEEHKEPASPEDGASRSLRASKTPLSPTRVESVSFNPAPDSLAARYDCLTKSTSSEDPICRKESTIIDLSDDDNDNNNAPYMDHSSYRGDYKQEIAVRPSKRPVVDDEDELEEVLDPTLAALQAKARQKALQRTHSAGTPAPDGEHELAPVAQLFIESKIPDGKPLMVKVRIDTTIERPRKAWCDRQGYGPEMKQRVFFTWKGTRLYDSTTVKRLGVQVDKHGNISMGGDSNIYDDVNLPKIHVEAWTEELFQKWKKEDSAAIEAKKAAAEAPVEAEEQEPTPEPEPVISKIRLVLKVKGKDDFRLSVKPDTTFEHIASAYKTKLKIAPEQPITLMFDNERLSPMDTVADSEIEDLDSIEVHFK